MNARQPDIALAVDERNPGQFFGCCGLLEFACRLWPGAEGWFTRRNRVSVFQVATGQDDALGKLESLICDSGELVALAEDHAPHAADRKPVLLRAFGDMRLDWWLTPYGDGDKSELKIWAGQQRPDGKINDMRQAWHQLREPSRRDNLPSPLLARRRPLTGRFGFDPSTSWEAVDVGFSPDEQGLPVQTAPATELLAAVGLQRCRPAVVEGRGRWFSYRTWRDPVEISLVPAVMSRIGEAWGDYEFPVVMRNAQYGSFGWARPARRK